MTTKNKYFFFSLPVMLLLTFYSAFGQQSPDMLQSEAERHMRAGRYTEAISLLNELIVLTPDAAQPYVMRGKCFEATTQYKSAVEDLRKANKLKPGDTQITSYLAKLEQLRKSEMESDIDKLEKELSLNPKLYQDYVKLAWLYLENGNKDKAENLYKQYMESINLSPDIIMQYGDFLAKTNLLKEGESAFGKYSLQFPDNELIKNRYGYFNLWLGNFKKAENIFREVLKKDPNLKEAQDGYKQAKAKGYFTNSMGEEKEIKTAVNPNLPPNKIEQYKKMLANNPDDYKTRLIMIDELMKAGRLDESFDQLQIVLKDTIHIPVFSSYRDRIIQRRDSVFNIIVADYKNILTADPGRKDIVSKIAYFYSSMGDYDNAMQTLSNYFSHSDVSGANDLRYQYALYASWNGKFEEALKNLDYLLSADPGNLQYQLLKGKVLVWSNKDPDLAERYLQNNLKAGNQSMEIILTLVNLYIQNNKLEDARKYITWGKTIDPESKELKKVEELYEEHKKVLAEQRVYSIIEEGRRFAKKGDCGNAIIKFDEYFSYKHPTESELVEYADLFNCQKNLDKAIEVYDRILKNDSSNYEVAKLRAKDILWKKDYKNALLEFQKLSNENPDDYECRVLMGEAYQNLGNYSMASAIYNDVLKKSSDKKIVSMIDETMAFMPQTGFSSLFSNFPSPIGFTPSVIYYSDNQDFSLNNVGGRMEVGIAKMLVGGASYSNVILQSSLAKRKFVEFKGHLFLNITDELQIHGAYGTLNSIYLAKKNIGDGYVKYGDNKTFSTEVSYEHNDAAMILDSPYLINLRYNADIYKVSGFFEKTKNLYLSGYFSYLSISDGNIGNDFMLRIGSQLIDDAYFGYEARYTSYKYNSPFVPYSNQTLKLYYSPQNLDSHSLWTKWNLINEKGLKFQFDATVGYIPLYNVVLRQVGGNLNYSPFGKMVINLQLSAGSSYRFDSSYNYFSGLASLYWQVY